MNDATGSSSGIDARWVVLQRPGFTILYERSTAGVASSEKDVDAVARYCRENFGETRIIFRSFLGRWFELLRNGNGRAEVLELAADELADLLELLGLEY
jgi:hypothetical protein